MVKKNVKNSECSEKESSKLLRSEILNNCNVLYQGMIKDIKKTQRNNRYIPDYKKKKVRKPDGSPQNDHKPNIDELDEMYYHDKSAVFDTMVEYYKEARRDVFRFFEVKQMFVNMNISWKINGPAYYKKLKEDPEQKRVFLNLLCSYHCFDYKAYERVEFGNNTFMPSDNFELSFSKKVLNSYKNLNAERKCDFVNLVYMCQNGWISSQETTMVRGLYCENFM